MPNKNNLIRYGLAGVIAIVGIVAGSVSYGTLAKNSAKGGGADTTSSGPSAKELETQFLMEKFGDSEVKAAYDFKPEEVVIHEEDATDYFGEMNGTAIVSILGSATTYATLDRGEGYHICYMFEGATAEGWQGDYSLKKAFLTLWDDGVYVGSSNGTKIYGYWYNRDASGEECLILKDKQNAKSPKDMVCNYLGANSYYQWNVDVLASYNNGRMIKSSGFAYYPVLGMYVDTGEDTLTYHVGDTIDTNAWTAKQVRGGVDTIFAGGIFDAENTVKYTLPSTAVAGEATVVAKWDHYQAEFTVNIVE